MAIATHHRIEAGPAYNASLESTSRLASATYQLWLRDRDSRFRHIGVVHHEYAVSPDGPINSALEPQYEEFRSRTIWSLSNAFTSAFKERHPIPQFRATARPGEFLERRFKDMAVPAGLPILYYSLLRSRRCA